MDLASPVLLSGSLGWPWIGLSCALFFLCGGTIAWILGYQAGFAEGKYAVREERAGGDQSRI